MKNYTYRNNLISKKQLRQLLAWSFSNYDSMRACSLADELKYLGFKYASQSGISISIEDLKVPFTKDFLVGKGNEEGLNTEKAYLKGKMTDVERFQKIISIWSFTSESLKQQVVYYFKNYDPLNSVYIMAFSGARGNLAQVRQLVGMRGIMSNPSGEILKIPIRNNFREGLTITDYLISAYGARKGIIDTALKTANSGYLTRRLIDVAQDILIREKDCLTHYSCLIPISNIKSHNNDIIYNKLLGRVLNKPILDPQTKDLIAKANTQINSILIKKFKQKSIREFYLRSPLTCNLYRSICQRCYGWDLSHENLVDIGETIGILAGQSIGEPGTQLTMRTFHTGGIFTSEIQQQVLSPLSGIIRFYKNLKAVVLRTNRGEEVFVTKNSGLLILIPDDKNQKLVEIKVLRNTILFPKHNQYIFKNAIIGELINENKQIRTETKPMLSDTCGEIFIPRLKNNFNLLNSNKLIWILSGQLSNSPNNSFINFYPDHKLNKYSYIFRTKIINHYNGLAKVINNKEDLYKLNFRILNNKYSLLNSNFRKLTSNIDNKNYLLSLFGLKYLIKILVKNSKTYLQITRDKLFGTLVTNLFKTLTGGTLYYDHRNLYYSNQININIPYWNRFRQVKKHKNNLCYKTIIWLGEEIHEVNCDKTNLLVKHGGFVFEGFELIPNVFAKTSGIVSLQQTNTFVHTISIKSGVVCKGRKFKDAAKKIYYPGEIILSTIKIRQLSFCEYIEGKYAGQLLIRPIEIYEFAHLSQSQKKYQNYFNKQLNSKSIFLYKPNQTIKSTKNLNLVSSLLTFKTSKWLNNNLSIEVLTNKKANSIEFQTLEKFYLNNHILPGLKYKNIRLSFLVQKNQFLDAYSTIGYLESITLNSLEIVKFKIKKQDNKKIFLISSKDCLTIKKDKTNKKNFNNFLIDGNNGNETGKILAERNNFVIVQKGRPYFFPNCNNEDLSDKNNLQYKLISPNRVRALPRIEKDISLNYYNISKLSVKKKYDFNQFSENPISFKTEFSKLILKQNRKLYSCLIPQFFKKFTINNSKSKLIFNKIVYSMKSKETILKKNHRTLLMQNLNINTSKNSYNKLKKPQYQLALVKFFEHPFTKSTKSVGLHSITDDYIEQETNSVFCQNNGFIESDETIGLLNLEKEITGDIVQGLPKIEEVLEARKEKMTTKKIPTIQKKGLIVQKTSLDPDFEFRKLGTSIKENDKINPHKLLKVYFNYYGSIKFFICDRIKLIKYNRLINNYESSYKSFKKVQLFILNSVQSVYESQGVSINDKHLEVIIKQMTTKVLITYEGDTSLLRREMIDLYHISYVNEIIDAQQKRSACYVPLLLGITKASLNNPSFISAASFQEATKVLTKAAIEGRTDWLRGLKENIIVGHLIPAGTGLKSYRNSFKKPFSKHKIISTPAFIRTNITQKTRQVF